LRGIAVGCLFAAVFLKPVEYTLKHGGEPYYSV